MGCVYSCFQVEDYEDHTNPSSSVNRCLVNNLFNLYISLFIRSETPSLQATTVSITSYDNFMSNTFHSTPRPLPYDSDPGYYLRSRRDSSLVSRREKGSSHSHEEAQPLRSDADDEDSESFSVEGSKWANKLIISCDNSKEDFSKSTRRTLMSKTMDAVDQGVYIMPDDEEDVCPTCLEEYTSENPKIVTKCSHHYHLSCIYEWMERSQDCPVCGKVMEFNETP